MDPSTINLELGLSRTTGPDACAGRHPAAALPGQRGAPATQPRHQVVQLGEFDLGLALLGAGVLGENVQDQRGPIDDLDPQLLLQVAQLAGRQLAVTNDCVGPGGLDDLDQLGYLAGSDVGSAVGVATTLDDCIQHDRSGGLGQPSEFGH